jgi:hypothetical protein
MIDPVAEEGKGMDCVAEEAGSVELGAVAAS